MRLGMFGKLILALCALALAGGCSTLNVADTANPLFDASEIAPVNLQVSSLDDGGWSMELDSRGPELTEAVLVYADGTTEVAELSGMTATVLSESTLQLVC